MHELSIAHGIIRCVRDAAQENHLAVVREVTIRLGPLAGVLPAALGFAWEMAAEGTICAGSKLTIQELAIRAWCEHCREEVTLPEVNRFRCPNCHALTPDVRQGRELELVAIAN